MSIHNTIGRFSLLLMTAIIAHTAHAQQMAAGPARTGLGLGFDNHDYGNNVNLTYRYELKKPYLIYGGISYFIPSKNTSHLEFLNGYYGFNAVQYYAANTAQRIGFKGGVERYIKMPASAHYELFWFYDIQYNVISSRELGFVSTSNPPNFDQDTFVGGQINESHVSKLKNTVGGGIKFALDKQVYLSGALALGLTLEQTSREHKWIPWEYLASVQLHYVFGYGKR